MKTWEEGRFPIKKRLFYAQQTLNLFSLGEKYIGIVYFKIAYTAPTITRCVAPVKG